MHRLPQMHRPLPRRRAHDGPRVTHDTDVLVIGAGRAGALAAWEAKRAVPELDVLLLERDAGVGTPVRCAEGVGDAGLREFADPEGAPWAARKITRVVFVAPDDTEVKVAERDVGWILDRTRFDAVLAERAVALGVERSEEHTSELQSRLHLVCRLLLEKKKNIQNDNRTDMTSAGS